MVIMQVMLEYMVELVDDSLGLPSDVLAQTHLKDPFYLQSSNEDAVSKVMLLSALQKIVIWFILIRVNFTGEALLQCVLFHYNNNNNKDRFIERIRNQSFSMRFTK